MYEVLIERSAERDLRALDPEVFRRIVPRIRSLSQNPRPSGCHKITGSKNDWRIRVGEYRLIYEVDDKNRPTRKDHADKAPP